VSIAAQRYHDMDLASRIDGASPHALVAMLYEELGVALDVMAHAAATDRAASRIRAHERGSAILQRLETGLDPVRGGALARSLASIYRQMRARMIAARSGDSAAIAELREGVTALAEAWRRVGV
jgi:flagellar secretion chaperone FliS